MLGWNGRRPGDRGQASPPFVGWLTLLLLLGVVIVFGLAFAQPAAAQTTVEPIYNNSTVDNATVIDNATWMEGREDPTVQNTSSFLSDIAAFVIGTGSAGAGGATGALVTGMLLFGAVISITGRSQVGAVAGGVLAAVTTATLVEIALAPLWLLAVVLMAAGVLLAAIYLRVVR